jgi:uncharacterized integral membrane protein
MFKRAMSTFFKGFLILVTIMAFAGIFTSTVNFDIVSFWNIFGGIQIVVFGCMAVGGIINFINYCENNRDE